MVVIDWRGGQAAHSLVGQAPAMDLCGLPTGDSYGV